ncbi:MULTISPECIES: hypothetical protein [Candidatus Ichthyocystis]|uniref:hypothetical protein n=1 Tax=Candidatus Ichthyocystis TaxID=2929841 RepID=UPI0011475C4B|nr:MULTISPECIES: hypothetical protein [Ichthyocystis]
MSNQKIQKCMDLQTHPHAINKLLTATYLPMSVNEEISRDNNKQRSLDYATPSKSRSLTPNTPSAVKTSPVAPVIYPP